MSVIDKIVSEIKAAIPIPVLEVAFLKYKGRNHKHASGLDWEIRNKVIDARIRQDLSILGSETINVPLANAQVQFLENQDYRTVLRIPKTLTKGRAISQVIAFNYWYNTVAADLNNGWQTAAYGGRGCGSSPMMTAAQQIVRAASPAPINSSGNVELIGENVIQINDYMGKVSQGSMTVRIGQDSELSNWNNAAIFQLCQWAVMGAKAWIWSNTIIDLDNGYLYGGAELGRIQQIIDGYSDANDNYTDHRENVIMAVNAMNDANRHQSFLRTIIAGQSR